MLIVKTRIAPSIIHGIGIFAEEDIPKDTQIWMLLPPFDLVFEEGEIAKLPEVAQEIIRKYSYKCPVLQKYVLDADDTRFMNHSDHPNCYNSGYDSLHSLREIKKGEELTIDYMSIFDDESIHHHRLSHSTAAEENPVQRSENA